MDAIPTRYPVPDALRLGGARLAKWMRIVGFVQGFAAGLVAIFAAGGLITSLGEHGPFHAGTLAAAAVLALLLVVMRQAALLQSAAEHLLDIGAESEHAHDHLVLAFRRLRPVFIIEVAIGGLLLVRNVLLTVMG